MRWWGLVAPGALFLFRPSRSEAFVVSISVSGTGGLRTAVNDNDPVDHDKNHHHDATMTFRDDESVAAEPVAASAFDDETKGGRKRFKGIIFDIDGTLADSWRLGYDATHTVLERHNIPSITPEIYHSCTRYTTPERLARHAGYEPDHDSFEDVGQQLAKEFDDLYVSLVSTETAGLYEGVLPLLQRIPDDIAVGALTNAAVRYAHAVLRTNCPSASSAGTAPAPADPDVMDLYGRFGSIRGADNVPAPKPSPEGLYQVCRDLGLDPADCVYVGDSPTDGVAAASAGMVSIGVLWGSHSRESLSRAPFHRLAETVEELEALLLGPPLDC